MHFTAEHDALRDTVRDFVARELRPHADEWEAAEYFPDSVFPRMGELGLLGVPWSEELGGADMDQLSYYITIHEMAKVDASHALTISAHTNLGTSPIVEFGTEEQKRRYVPLLAPRRGVGRAAAGRGAGPSEPRARSRRRSREGSPPTPAIPTQRRVQARRRRPSRAGRRRS